MMSMQRSHPSIAMSSSHLVSEAMWTSLLRISRTPKNKAKSIVDVNFVAAKTGTVNLSRFRECKSERDKRDIRNRVCTELRNPPGCLFFPSDRRHIIRLRPTLNPFWRHRNHLCQDPGNPGQQGAWEAVPQNDGAKPTKPKRKAVSCPWMPRTNRDPPACSGATAMGGSRSFHPSGTDLLY